jgi:hypothetical protein
MAPSFMKAASGGITGDLSVVDLPSFLQMAADQHFRGTLIVTRRGERKTLYLDGPYVQLAEVSPRRGAAPGGSRFACPTLGQILVSRGALTPLELGQALRRQVIERPTGKPPLLLGQLLRRTGLVAPDALDEALEEKELEELYDLCSWKDALFRFERGGPAPEDAAPPVEVGHLVLEAMRRRDERAEIVRLVPSRRLVPVPAREARPASVHGLDARAVKFIHERADGTRSVEQLLAGSELPEFGVELTLARLVERGKLQLIEPEMAAAGGGMDHPPIVVVASHFAGYACALAACFRRAGAGARALSLEVPASEWPQGPAPDVVVVDMGDQHDLPAGWRLRPEDLRSAVVLLVSSPSRRLIVSALRAGVRDIMVKPVSFESVVRRALKIIQEARAEFTKPGADSTMEPCTPPSGASSSGSPARST